MCTGFHCAYSHERDGSCMGQPAVHPFFALGLLQLEDVLRDPAERTCDVVVGGVAATADNLAKGELRETCMWCRGVKDARVGADYRMCRLCAVP